MNKYSKLWPAVQRRLQNRRFWRNSGLLMSANIIVMALGLVRMPILTRLLSKDEVGMIGVVAALLPFLQLFSLPGLDSAAHHYVSKGFSDALRINITVRLRWSLLSVFGFLVGSIYWWLWGDNLVLAGLFVIAALTYPVTNGLTAVAGYLGAKEKFGHLFWYRLVEAVSRYAGILLLWLIPVFSTQVIYFSFANSIALGALQIIAATWLFRQIRQEKAQPMPLPQQKEMAKYGKHLTLIGIISTAQTRIDALLISWFLPLSIVADYSIGQLVYAQFKRLWTVYYGVRYPPLVRLPLPRRRRRIILEMILMGIAFVLFGLAAGVGLWLIVPIIFPPEYASSLLFINWLIAAFIVGIPGYFVEMYFRTCQNERAQYLLRGVAAVSGILLPTLLLIFWQAQGVVIGRFAASFVLSAFGLLLFWQDKGKISQLTASDFANTNTNDQ